MNAALVKALEEIQAHAQTMRTQGACDDDKIFKDHLDSIYHEAHIALRSVPTEERLAT